MRRRLLRNGDGRARVPGGGTSGGGLDPCLCRWRGALPGFGGVTQQPGHGPCCSLGATTSAPALASRAQGQGAHDGMELTGPSSWSQSSSHTSPSLVLPCGHAEAKAFTHGSASPGLGISGMRLRNGCPLFPRLGRGALGGASTEDGRASHDAAHACASCTFLDMPRAVRRVCRCRPACSVPFGGLRQRTHEVYISCWLASTSTATPALQRGAVVWDRTSLCVVVPDEAGIAARQQPV